MLPCTRFAVSVFSHSLEDADLKARNAWPVALMRFQWRLKQMPRST